MKTEWEAINDNTARMEVPGGWLYRTTAQINPMKGGPTGVALAFVPTSDRRVELAIDNLRDQIRRMG